MKRNADFLLREVADTLVIVPVGAAASDFSGMITVNAVGAFVWEQLAQEQTVESLTDALVAEYAVDRELAKKDVEAFVNNLLPTGAILEN